MSVNYKIIANFAREMSKHKSEIYWRNSIARAYYAAYHQALAASEDCSLPSSTKSSQHDNLKDRYKQHGSKFGVVIAQWLSAMKRQREISEYQLRSPVSKDDAENQLSLYDQTSEEIDEFTRQYGNGRKGKRKSAVGRR